MLRLIALGAIAVLLSPVVAWSQDDVSILAGSRLRVTEREGRHDRYLGTVGAMSRDSVVVRIDKSGRRAPFAWAGLSRIEVGKGKKGHTAVGAGIGLVAGVVVGGLIGAVTTNSDTDMEDWSNALAGAGIGAALGMIIGGVIGARHETERWSDVEVGSISVSAGICRNGDLALELSVHF